MGMDWRLGADFMESMLIDYDPCSNWGNWHALAGLNGGTIHRFNVLKQAKTYDPDGRYVQHWIPELSQLPGKSCIEPYKAGLSDLREAGVVLGETYPRPIKTHPWGPKYGVSHVTSGKSNGRKTSGVRNRDRKDSNRRKQRSIDSYFSTSIGNKE
ncbi:hypothetical protein SARC_15133 [Sphaeroforma arctica JP610]|uniref:Cryptochrome/DNA photolyase FAD-binding domain-containing protein n=1 Tax=Sphaeroforma arctica JP610 TaxID=667725 RepID=A0A0L0F6G5_9EUKA|nr:hypothetical protein SARC_15133 [Sphaeroforma arctica JP610]KNC72315.1 hypothetical protein SARC_15133 [Sphaeroforma arctica JP610]|eukprot:XP_014146217.1 hypothetical protein SARC_15133 [Sphaeroforma arctica JP610]